MSEIYTQFWHSTWWVDKLIVVGGQAHCHSHLLFADWIGCVHRKEARQMNWTKTPPTRLGDWKWRIKEGAPEYVGSLFWDGGRLVFETAGFSEYVGLLNGEWSGPLVPVEEVERAYREAWYDCVGTNERLEQNFANSRARRIVQGEQV